MVFGSSLFASSFCGEVREKNSPKIRNTHKSIVSTPVVSEEKRDEE
jgi:hypothetical protein